MNSGGIEEFHDIQKRFAGTAIARGVVDEEDAQLLRGSLTARGASELASDNNIAASTINYDG